MTPIAEQPREAVKFTYGSGARPLDGYTIKRGVGRGGFGEVYYATSDGGKEVAIKLIRRHLDVELRGVKQCLNLKHPHLLGLFDVRQDGQGDSWVVMEYVRGEGLEQRLAKHPQGLTPEEAMRWFHGLAAAVAYLHDRGIVHRDLKPGNVFDEDGLVKLGDYGLSKFISVSRRSGQTESIGTVHYMAPEIGNGRYGKEIDIYALGILLYEMLTGRVPFEGESVGEVLMKHLTAEPDVSRLAEPYRSAVKACLAKDPAVRPQSVSELVAMLPAATHAPLSPGPTVPARSDVVLADAPRRPDTPTRPPASADPVRTARQPLPPPGKFLPPPARNVGFAVLMVIAILGASLITRFGGDGGSMLGIPVLFMIVVMLAVRWWQSAPSRPARLASNPTPPPPAFLPAGASRLLGATIAAVATGVLCFVFGLIGAEELHMTTWSFLIVIVPALLLVTGGVFVLIVKWGSSGRIEQRSANASPSLPFERTPSRREAVPALEWKPMRERVADLLGSMLMAAAISLVLALVGLIVTGSPLRPEHFAWLALTTTVGTWLVLIASKSWEGVQGDASRRRVVMLVAGLALGAFACWIDTALEINLGSNMMRTRALPSQWTSHAYTPDGQPALPEYLAFFGVTMLVVRWWRLADPQRSSRVNLREAAKCVVVAYVVGFIWPFPLPWALLVVSAMALAVQLAGPWQRRERKLKSRP